MNFEYIKLYGYPPLTKNANFINNIKEKKKTFFFFGLVLGGRGLGGKE